MLNVRINDELEKKLKQYSEQKNITKSDIVKEALVQYFTKEEISSSPYALGSDLFGLAGSGDPEASSTYKSKLKKKLSEKHSH